MLLNKMLKKILQIGFFLNSLISFSQKNVSPINIEPQKDLIQFEDFSKMDIRVGTILSVERMPNRDKLLIFKVDIGIDVRTIISGVSESFSPEEITGKRVSVLANLAPRSLYGVESYGMILMTTNAEGKLVFVNPDADGVGNGETIN
jgi:methionyl-tRNA synthetase